MKRIVLLGKNGFVGSNIWALLSDLNYGKMKNYRVVAPQRHECDLTKIDSLRLFFLPGDIVINAAGYAHATDRTELGKKFFFQTNVLGVKNLVSISSEKKISQLIHISSVAAMGRMSGLNLNEKSEGIIDSPYAQSKHDGEKILASYQSDMNITILRPTSIVGRGRGLVESLIKIINWGIIPLPDGGNALLPLSHIGNFVKAVELVLDNPICYGKTYIVGDENSYVLREVVEKMIELTKTRTLVLSVPSHIMRPVAYFLEETGKLTGTPPILDRWRLANLTTPIQYDISAIVQDTGYQVDADIFEALENMFGRNPK